MVSGLYSEFRKKLVRNSLNPCFSGGWSRSVQIVINAQIWEVLILVLVEDGLGVRENSILCAERLYVLILVLVEDGLGVT